MAEAVTRLTTVAQVHMACGGLKPYAVSALLVACLAFPMSGEAESQLAIGGSGHALS